ncbi:MAG: curli assembly protein CsgF [Tunicatimonas sp.]
MKYIFCLILMTSLAVVTHAQDFTYQPQNPAFGDEVECKLQDKC